MIHEALTIVDTIILMIIVMLMISQVMDGRGR
jgi:hypothetical protein